jgi:predicted ATPase
MDLIFSQEYKSIKHLPIATLPDFTVITGVNGSGKTHFLEALRKGRISASGTQLGDIKYYNWTSLVPSDEQALQPRQLEDKRNTICYAIIDILEKTYTNILFKIADHKRRFPDSYAISITKQQVEEIAVKFNESLKNGDTSAQYEHLAVAKEQIVKVHIFNAYQSLKSNINKAKSGLPATYNIETSRGQNANLNFDQNTGFVLDYIIKNSQKPFFTLTLKDCLSLYPLVAVEKDPFIGSLNNLFAGYVEARFKNAVNKVLTTDYDKPTAFLTKEEFLAKHGLPPWEVFNSVLTEAKLREPSPDASISLQARLEHMHSGIEVDFANLSSGERVLISLAHFLFFSQDPRQPTAIPELILLDEVDAPLHPSMIVDLLRTITQIMVGKYKRKVILATHSPTTVALAPEDSVYLMDINTKNLHKVTRDEAVSSLTVGVPTLSINLANRRQIFVESEHDVMVYERITELARTHLIPNVSLSFIAAGHSKNGGCELVISLVEKLTNAGNKAVFGIVDWDGNRSSKNALRVLGESVRHSIENYLFDPILIGALLLREKAPILFAAAQPGLPLLEGTENYFSLREFDNTRLQRIADAMAISLGFTLTDLVSISYANKREVQVPKDYLILRGHDLEDRIKSVFPEVKRFHQEPKLKEEIIHKILEEIPELLPNDFLTLLLGIQNTTAN